MSDNKIDITSTAIEKGFDTAKGFLNKLIMPTVEEVGLLFKDRVTLWRFKNQIKMLTKAEEFCIKNKIDPKKISLKVVCPLLDYSSLEEDEVLQDKWAILLSNMVDSDQNIENHVFPYILSQISTNEFLALETTVMLKEERIKKYKDELEEFRKGKPEKEKQLQELILQKEKEIEIKRLNKEHYWDTQQEKWKIETELRGLSSEENKIAVKINEPEFISGELREYEISNLIRLGLIKLIQKNYGWVSSHKIRNDPHSEYLNLEDATVEIETDFEDYILTELGELFIKACTEKSKLK
jgi:hypothetical protein